MIGSEVDVYGHGLFLVDDDEVVGGPVLGAVEGVLEGSVVGGYVFSVDTIGRVIDVLLSNRCVFRASLIKIRKYKAPILVIRETLLIRDWKVDVVSKKHIA